MNMNTIKTLGLVATLAGMGATLVSSWVDDKKVDEKIETQVNKALTDREKEESEEES